MTTTINNQQINAKETQTSEVPNVITQRNKHRSRSDKYLVVTSEDLLKMFEEQGFTWRLVAQERSRKQEYKGYGTHLIALEAPTFQFADVDLQKEVKPMIYMKNSYHGRTSLVLDLGLFRFYCSNGLFLGNLIERKKLIHRDWNKDKVAEVVKDMERLYNERVAPLIKSMMTYEMSQDQQLEFARLALEKRLSDCPNFIKGSHEKLLTTLSYRQDDEGNSLWKVFQRVQENLGLNFRGNPMEISYTILSKDKDGNDQEIQKIVQKTTSIKKVTEMNQWLFDCARQIVEG